MKSVLLFFSTMILLAGPSAFATNELHLFAPGLQYRYENDSDQSIKNRRYDNYNIAGIIFDDYLVGAELDQFQQETGNASLNITEKFQEINLYAGYFVYSRMFNEEYKIALDVGPIVYVGQNHTTVISTVGSVTQQSNGEDNLVYGLGLQATARFGFLLLQPEMRYAWARSYQPSPLPVYGIRLGFRIGL